MFEINNSSPDQIVFNNNDVGAVAVSNEGTTKGVWAKAFTLTVTPIAEAELDVLRTLSPYKGASTGLIANSTGTLTTTIYYGDVIRFDAKNFAQNYEFEYFLASGVFCSPNHFLYTVNSDVTVKILVKSTYTPSWKVVFSGQKDSTHQTSTTLSTYSMSFNGIKTDLPTRVTGTLMKETSSVVSSFTAKTLPISLSYNGKTQKILEIDSANTLKVQLQRPTPTFTNKAPFFRITKIEQYY